MFLVFSFGFLADIVKTSKTLFCYIFYKIISMKIRTYLYPKLSTVFLVATNCPEL